MISFRASSVVVPFFGLLVALSGCAAQTTSADSADTAQAQSPVAAQQAQNARMHGPRGGNLLVAALREPSLNLTDAQKQTIESALQASAPPKGERPDMSARSKELAAQIRSGNIDTTTAKGPSEAEISAHRAAEAKALDTLHSTLTADQRKALVAALESGPAHKGAKQGRPMEENQVQGVREHHGRHGGGEHGMRGLLEDLNLSQAQKDQIKAKMEADKPSDADREAMKAKFETMQKERTAKLETFASDKFDANAFVTPPAGAQNAPKVDRHAKELAIITSVLDASQREKLAQKIEQGPQMRERGPRPEGAPQPQGVAPAPVEQTK